MKTGTTRHRKVYALAEILSVRRAEAIGILTAFWELTSEQFPDGDISRAPLTYLAEQCLWYPERGQELLDALIKAELLDQMADGKMYIHDWHDHCENTVHRKIWRRKIWFANGLPPKFAAMDRADKVAATKWYSENTPQNSAGIPTGDNRIPTETPAVTVTSTVTPARAKPAPSTSSAAKAPAKPRKPDPWWDTICDVFGLTAITDTDGRRIGKLKREFKAKCEYAGCGPEEITRRRDNLIAGWDSPDMATPDATLKWWDKGADAPTAKAPAHGPDAQIPGVYYDSTGEIHLDPNAGAYDEEFVLQVEAEIRADMEQEAANAG